MSDEILRQTLRDFLAAQSQESYQKYLRICTRMGVDPEYCFCGGESTIFCIECRAVYGDSAGVLCQEHSRGLECAECGGDYCPYHNPQMFVCNCKKEICMDCTIPCSQCATPLCSGAEPCNQGDSKNPLCVECYDQEERDYS